MPGPEALLPAAALTKFALGYLAVLAAPGPNMLAIGALAALRGFRGVMPVCCGIAAGAGCLALALHLGFGLLARLEGLDAVARAVGGAMLLLVSLRVIRAPRPCLSANAPQDAAPPTAVRGGFVLGFLTALTNPVTAAYFISQFLGPLGSAQAAWIAAPVAAALALLVGLGIARIFGSAAMRRIAIVHHRALCLLSGAALALLAALLLLPLLRA